MVYYRKYRPQTIEELDSKNVRDALTAALSSKSVSHAFLFTGPKGLGKTSAARIVAKVVNCERLVNQRLASSSKEKKLNAEGYTLDASVEPCNKCYQCTSITNGSNIDVLEIDGASNRGIDEIRDLREKVRLAPAASKKKAYIIDEVHMLTQEAFNALLKTLEEPPSHVIFVLCTTEPHKVPATIVSRCSHIPFKKATIEELMRSFKRISEKEKLRIDNETLDFIASLSDGSFRDGVKILEEMAAYGKTITKELVQEKYQIRQLPDQISNMLEILAERDAKSGLKLVIQLVEQGVDMKYFLEQLISELHQMLLVEVGVYDARGPVAPSSHPMSSVAGSLRALDGTPSSRATPRLNITDIKELVELFARAYGELKYAVLPQLPLELAIIQWQALIHADQYADKRGVEIQRSSASNSASNSALFSDKDAQVKGQRTDSSQIWNELINKVKLYNHSIAGVLRGCSLKSYDNEKIVIETGFKFHKEKLDDGKTKAIIEKVCEELSGKPVAVSVILKIKN